MKAIEAINKGETASASARSDIAGFTAVAGWFMVAALVIAPWAFGSRPYFWSRLLATLLITAGIVWAFGLWREHRRPAVPKWSFLCVGLIAGLMWLSIVNPRSTYDPIGDRFLPFFRFIPWLPSTVDVANSLPSAVSLSGMLVALLVSADLFTFVVWRQRLIATMALTGLSVIVAGLLLKANLSPSLVCFLSRRPWAMGDIFGPFDYHGNAGAFINLVLPATAIQAATAAHFPVRFCWIAALVLGCLAALVNTSRVGLVLTVASLPTIGWLIASGWKQTPAASEVLHQYQRLAPAAVVIVILLAAVFVAYRGSKAFQRFAKLREEVSEPWYPRYQQNHAAWEMAASHPWLGTGIGSYRILVPHSSIQGNFFAPKYQPGVPYTVLSNTHDDYLQTLAEWGCLGLAAWVLLIGSILARLWKSLRTASPLRLAGVAAAVALATVYVHAVVDCPLQIPSLQLYTVTFLGLAIACGSAVAFPPSQDVPPIICSQQR